MTDDYQLRKELDNYKWLFDELTKELSRQGVINISELLDKFYDQSEIDIPLSKLSDDLTTLNTSLDVLQDSLVEFNGALIDFDEDNTNLEDDLTKLKDNLLDFLNVLGLLDVDLTQLQGELSTLDVQINGDSDNRGLADTLSELQLSIGALEGMLTDFGNQLNNIVDGDNALALSLSTLSGYLTTFKGNLSELQTQIIADFGQSIYDSLDEDLVKLIASITQTNDDLDSHKDLLDGLNDTIGSDTDTLNDGTLFGVLNNTSSVASSASTKANSVESTINNTVTPTLNQVTQTDIPNVKNKMGYSSIPNNSTLQGQITAHDGVIGDTTDTGSDNTLFGLINKTFDDIDEVQSDIGDVTQLSGTVVANITTAQGNITTVQGDISDIQSDIGTVPSGQTLQGQITANTGDISSQGSRITSAEGTITAHGRRLTTVEGQISTLDGQYSSVSSAVSDITDTELPRLDGALDTLGEFATALAYSLSQILKPTSDYTEIYYCNRVPDTQDLLIWEADYGYDTSNIMYAINQTGTEYVRNGSSWATGIIPSSITKRIGVIGYFDERPQEGFNPSFDYIYSVSTTEYFKLSSQ